MKILTWNIDCKTSQAKSWDYLLNEIMPDIALLQECHEFTNLGQFPGTHNLLRVPIGGGTGWGSAIYTRGLETKKVEVDPLAEGWIIGAEIELPDLGRTLVVSIHASLRGGVYVAPGLKDLFRRINERVRNYDHLIVGGDLNAARSWDTVHPSESLDHHHAAIFELFESQWCNCSLKYYGKEVQTVWTPSTKHPYQNDYIFVDKDLENRLVYCKIPPREKVGSLSDHSPVIVDLA